MGLWLQVDASRRQNDPRKATRGCRAWCGLEVSPARRRAGCRPGTEMTTSGVPVVLGVQPPPLVHRPPQQASVGAKTRSATGASAHTQLRAAPHAPPHTPRTEDAVWGRKRGPTPDRRPVLRPKPCPRADWTSKEKLLRTVIFSIMCGERAGGLLAGEQHNELDK